MRARSSRARWPRSTLGQDGRIPLRVASCGRNSSRPGAPRRIRARSLLIISCSQGPTPASLAARPRFAHRYAPAQGCPRAGLALPSVRWGPTPNASTLRGSATARGLTATLGQDRRIPLRVASCGRLFFNSVLTPRSDLASAPPARCGGRAAGNVPKRETIFERFRLLRGPLRPGNPEAR